MSIGLAWLRDVRLALRVFRAPFLISLFAALFLAAPPQTLEIYSILVQDLLYAGRWRELALAIPGLVLMSAAIWFATARLTSTLRHKFTPESADSPYGPTLDLAPKLLATLPIFAVAMGLWSAPRLANSEILQTFFELMGTGVVDSIDVSVTALANPLEGVWYSISSVLADFALGRAEIHGITNRDVLALLASDGLLHLGAHLFFMLALGLL